ncbi:MAG: MFS transporter [Candidatus Hadarchaeum sp.]|uniref:MFS transporter n=1 Tax=Candidatus Hadarchaeum sp. TaxID=2883567 RepID=UPI003D11F9E2
MQSGRVAAISIITFGLISLFGDIIYEGSRSIISPFLLGFGASAFIVGVVLGLGEFLGYALRIVFGVLSDKTRSYWTIFIAGYSLLIAVPLLAFAGSWPLAMFLILVERLSKAVRSPARDTVFSYATRGVGSGKAFGIHELLDQIGAVTGPAIVAAVLFTTGQNFNSAFSILFLPYLLMIIVALYAYVKLRPLVGIPIATKKRAALRGLPQEFIIYAVAVALNAMGLVSIGLILYRVSPEVLPWLVALIYLLAQAVDAVAAPLAGYLYDRMGRKLLYLPFALSVAPSTLIFMPGLEFVLLAAILFGAIFGMHESIYRAAVADLTPMELRGSAYGVFHTFYGLGLLISGAVFGFLMDNDLAQVAILFSVLTQASAMFLLRKTLRASAQNQTTKTTS